MIVSHRSNRERRNPAFREQDSGEGERERNEEREQRERKEDIEKRDAGALLVPIRRGPRACQLPSVPAPQIGVVGAQTADCIK